ncbi:hypothetical protein [Parathermosynechococcus lividus]|nr:hypothetical protein [Thermostichus lividus]
MNGWQRLVQCTVVFFLCLALFWGIEDIAWAKSGSELAEVAAPVAIEDLKSWFDRYEPRLQILSPQPNQTLEATTIAVTLQVEGLNIFQDPRTGLGPHVEVVLDDRPSRSVYDLKEPIEFSDLQPGTHLLRAFIVYPWGESIKSPLAYAERTFHLYTATGDRPTTPLLTYNQPQGVYGAEPMLLDFYLSNVPVDTDRPTWQVRCTINGQSFTVNRWQAYYLTGFKPGDNWVRLDLLDSNGQPIGNTTITRLVTYHLGGNDALSRLLRGELAAKNLQSSLSPSLPDQLPPPPMWNRNLARQPNPWLQNQNSAPQPLPNPQRPPQPLHPRLSPFGNGLALLSPLKTPDPF